MSENKEIKEITTEHFAMEVLKQEQEKSKAKNVGVISLTVAVIVITIGMAVINYRNDCDWRRIFSGYDFITQDGNGQNYYNSDIGGNASNGAEDSEEEEQE